METLEMSGLLALTVADIDMAHGAIREFEAAMWAGEPSNVARHVTADTLLEAADALRRLASVIR